MSQFKSIIKSIEVENPDNGDIVCGTVTISRRANSKFYKVKWDVDGLDSIYCLSEKYLIGTTDEIREVFSFMSESFGSKTGCRKGCHVSGSFRWGYGEGLSLKAARTIAISILRYWNSKVREWLKDECPQIELKSNNPIDIYDVLTRNGWKLNLITGKWNKDRT